MTTRFVLALLAAAIHQAGAQLPRDFDVIKVVDGVYAFVQKEPLASPIDGNTTVIINDDDVIVVDTRITPASAREVIREIRRLTRLPVRYVINTHWHSDHHYGNDAFRAAFPGVEFIAHPMMRADFLTQDTDSIIRVNVDSVYPATIAARRRALAESKLLDGSPMTPMLRDFYTKQIPALEYAVAELKTVKLVHPTMLVPERLTLHRGKRTIDIRFLGRANTRGDLVVHLPEERIVITGDILVWPVPFSFGSYLGDWTGTLAHIAELPVDVIVPGHGPPQRDREYLTLVRTLIDTTLAQVKRSVAEGKDLEATRRAMSLDALRRQFTGDDALRIRAFNGFFVTPATQRAWLEARGELP
jgi:cyclase